MLPYSEALDTAWRLQCLERQVQYNTTKPNVPVLATLTSRVSLELALSDKSDHNSLYYDIIKSQL